MKVIVTNEGLKLLKDLENTLSSAALELRYNNHPRFLTKQPTESSPMESLVLPQLPQCQIDVKTPRIVISKQFEPKYRKFRDSLQDTYFLTGVKKTFEPLTGTNEEESKVKKFLDEKIGKIARRSSSMESLAQVEARYNKVWANYRRNAKQRERLTHNMETFKRTQEQEQNERVERIRNLIEKENVEYLRRIQVSTRLARKKERIVRCLGTQYTKLWDGSNVSLLSAPKGKKQKYHNLKEIISARDSIICDQE